jgi:hypothetical protein
MGLTWLLLAATRLAKPHLRFLFVVVLPVTCALIVVWYWLVAAPPGEPLHSNAVGGLGFALMISTRLVLLGGILQLGLMTVPRERIIDNLRSVGIGKRGIAIACGVVSVVPELSIRSKQVLVARYARGLMKRRSIFGKLLQIPYLARPLLVWAIRVAIERADSWRQKSLLDNLSQIWTKDESYSLYASIAVGMLGLLLPIYIITCGR